MLGLRFQNYCLCLYIFRIVLAKYPIDLVQGCSLAVDNLFSAIVVHLDNGALVTKEVRILFSSSVMLIIVVFTGFSRVG